MCFRYVSLLIILLVKSYNDLAQTADTIPKMKSDTVKQVPQVDIYDIVRFIFHKPPSSRPDTQQIAPWHLLFSFTPAFGYSLDQSYVGSITSNVSFYTADQTHTNISILYLVLEYSVLNQFQVPIQSRIWLKNNKWCLRGDWRFYSYPSKTYGLGSTSTLTTVDDINYLFIKVHEEILRCFNKYYFIGGGYYYDNHWDVRDYTNITDYPLYNGNLTQYTSGGPGVTMKYDSRANGNNPDKGFYASIFYRYNLTQLGSISDWQMAEIELRKYFPLGRNIVLAFWDLDRLCFGGYVPYLDLPSNGFGTEHYTERGYIQGRFRGADMLYEEGELRFPILRNGFLGGVVFANAGSYSNWPQGNINSIFPAGGFGLRFKFNKYSKVNVCADYAWGIGGSQGIFFNLGEVF